MSLHFKKIRAETTASGSFDLICRVRLPEICTRVVLEYEYEYYISAKPFTHSLTRYKHFMLLMVTIWQYSESHTAWRSQLSWSISCLSRVTCCTARLRSNWAWDMLTFMLSVAYRPHTDRTLPHATLDNKQLHTVIKDHVVITILLVIKDQFTSPCPCPRTTSPCPWTTKFSEIVKDFAFFKQSVIHCKDFLWKSLSLQCKFSLSTSESFKQG